MTGQVDLSWTDNSDVEDSHELERKEGSGSYILYGQPSANDTSFSDTVVTDAVTYHYRIRAYNSAGTSSYSNEVTESIPLSSPDSLFFNISNEGEIVVDWDRHDDNPNGEWQIYRSDASNPSKPGDYSQVATVSDATTTQYTDTGLVDGRTYHYFVRRSVNGETADTGTNDATTILPAPSNFSATPQSSSQVDLSWTKEDNNTTGTWEIYRSTDGSLGSVISSPSPSTTSYSDTNVSTGTTYYYTLRRITDSGEEVDSTQQSATVPITISGTVTLSGSGVSGAKIHVIDDTNGDIEATTTTDSNGDYSVNVPAGETYHVTCQYDDGSAKYNSESKPYVT